MSKRKAASRAAPGRQNQQSVDQAREQMRLASRRGLQHTSPAVGVLGVQLGGLAGPPRGGSPLANRSLLRQSREVDNCRQDQRQGARPVEFAKDERSYKFEPEQVEPAAGFGAARRHLRRARDPG